MVARGEPAASITARISPIRSSRVLLCGTVSIREPLAAFVENDNPRKHGKSFQQVQVGRHLPGKFFMRKRPWDQHDVTRTSTEDAKCEVNVSTLRIPDGGFRFASPAPESIRLKRCRDPMTITASG